MEATIRIDKQGRMVLPKDVRKALGVSGDAEIVCRVVGNKVILKRFSVDSIRKAFAELEEIAPSLELHTVKTEGEDKYFDREYALRKIGVLEALFYGKALITRPSRTLMLRDIKNYKEVILVSNIPQYVHWIRKIVSDDDFRSQLEYNAKQYYLHKLSPLIQGKQLEKYFSSLSC